MEVDVKEAYIRFMAPVMPQTATQLFQIIDAKLREKCERIHLLISSNGGSVFHGLSLYNFLRGAPFELFTYNFGSVDSIGVVLFCAGKRRFSVPHARFLIHGVSATFMGNQTIDEKGLEERIKSLQIDYKNIARVIADTCGRPAEKVQDEMNNRTTLDPTQGKEYGLVHEIKSELFPVDADLSSINETAQGQPLQFPFPQGFPIQLQQVTVPNIQGVTEMSELEHITHS
jgi:ATP-dependent protease ClpP protease subunit